MGRTEAIYNSQPINENGGEEAIILPDENPSETESAKADEPKPAKQNQPSRSENTTQKRD